MAKDLNPALFNSRNFFGGRKPRTKGIFITFEGPEGSGKSTQSDMLCIFLKKQGFNVLRLREPGGTRLGEIIRGILLNSKKIGISPAAEALLYVAARAELVSEKIIPSLKKGNIVVCDRFADATVVYQGYGLGVNKKMLINMNNFATENIKPDITFLLDLTPKVGLKRSRYCKGYADRIEKRAAAFHKRVRSGYLDLAKKNIKRIKVLSVQKQSKEQIQKLIRRMVLGLIRKNSR